MRRTINLKDNLFLDRYAQSVTDNGNNINLNNTSVPGYGVWRLTENDFSRMMNATQAKNMFNTSSNVTTNLFTNIENGCGNITNLTESIELTRLLKIVNDEPCVSAMSLITLLEIDGNYPVPVKFNEQERLLSEVSDQIIVDFQVRNRRIRSRGVPLFVILY